MSVLMIFVILIVLIVGGKFVYDTYMTNNTENSFKEFRKINPIEAAKIEAPKTDEEFVHLVKAIDKKVSYESSTIVDLFPELAVLISNMTLIENSHNSLAVQTSFKVKEDDPLTTTFKVEKDLTGKYFFESVLIDKYKDQYDSEKVFVCSSNSIDKESVNWEVLFENSIKDIEQQRSKALYQLTALDHVDSFLRYDGYYSISNIDGSGATLVLRFYSDGLAIFVRLMGDPYSIVKWFNRDSTSVMKGMYSVDNGVLDFKVSSTRLGKCSFLGYIIDKNQIFLKVNDKREATFHFLVIDENKVYRSSKNDTEEDEDYY